ncbi:MAG: L-seryl-tRNA(Sec) selenium transferase, partial [Betaproteobacteria bacterium]|nr:L-seryl-tRNA(Sec) selenium transferase [Betaproteobacteria bacterium]
AAGADLVTFSGDKLLGGPQAGLVVGKRDLVERLRKSPMKRALRLDKGRIAALEAVLRLYLDPQRLAERLPALRQLTRTSAGITAAAARMRPALQDWCGRLAKVTVAPCASQVGSGSLPVDRLPSAALRIASSQVRPAAIAKALRALPVPVIARIHEDAVWLDLRCLEDEEGFAANLCGRSLA